MNSQQFTESLEKRWKYEKANIIDIEAYVSFITEDQKSELMKLIINNYEYNTPPKLAYIRKLAEKNKIYQNKKSRYVFYYRCQACDTAYNFKSRGCPKCRKMTEVKVVKSTAYPQDAVFAKDNCFECDEWKKKPLGAVCEHWGKDIAISPQERQMCKDCICRKCCYEEKKNRIERGLA